MPVELMPYTRHLDKSSSGFCVEAHENLFCNIGYFLSEILRNIICDGLYNQLRPQQQMSEVIRISGWAQQVNSSITRH